MMQVEERIRKASEYEAEGDRRRELETIADGLSLQYDNYELLYMMGLMLETQNPDQAFLYLEQAAWYCSLQGQEEDLAMIRDHLDRLVEEKRPAVRRCSVVVLSYNDRDLMQKCLAALRKYHEFRDGEIIIVDNASTDGVSAWLEEQAAADPRIRLILSKENLGFSKGCNLGAGAANEDTDLLFLNNDAVLTPNALLFLRLGLYEGQEVGAAGAMSNSASMQEVPGLGAITVREAMDIGKARNLPMHFPYEDRCRLTGFALLLKREAVSRIALRAQEDSRAGEGLVVFDPRFSPAYFEDDDLGMRLAQAGYRQLLCRNSFIYHAGGPGNPELMSRSRDIFREKWGFDIWEYALPWEEAVEGICHREGLKTGGQPGRKSPEDNSPVQSMKPLRILQIEAGMGATLSGIRSLFPCVHTVGLEASPTLAGLGRRMGVLPCGNREYTEFPFNDGSFDYILLGDYPERSGNSAWILKKLERFLGNSGHFIVIETGVTVFRSKQI